MSDLLTTAANWWLNMADRLGIWAVLAIPAAAGLTAWCATGAALHHRQHQHIRRGIRRLEHHANQPRKEKPQP